MNLKCSLVRQQVVPVITYALKSRTLAELLKDGINESHAFISAKGKLKNIQYDSSPSAQKMGGFKVAYFGTIDAGKPFSTKSESDDFDAVCIKLAFYKSKGREGQPDKITLYLGPSAITRIIGELRCLSFSQVLLTLVYDVMDAFEAMEGDEQNPVQLPSKRPNFRFVHAALGIEQGKDPRDTKTFMIEELIDEPREGRFRKYLNNTSLTPCKFAPSDLDNINRANFLAFTQHVQYWKTGKLAFVADYQGV